MRVAVIPARGGSKRIPRKNLKTFNGQPILAYSIEAAAGCGLFDRIVVSTDDDEIADVARARGAEAPFRRPAELADDHTGTNAVVRHALDWLEGRDGAIDEACCIYATAPFLSADDLREAHALLAADVDFVFSATSFEFPIQRALRCDAERRVSPMFPQWIGSRSQDLEEAIHDAGQFYWGRPAAFRQHDVVFEAAARAFMLPRHRVQDIDTSEDWQRAELMHQVLFSR